VHLHRYNRGSPATCNAFPTGIPDDIVFGYNHHTEPFLDDNGIRFVAQEGFQHLTAAFERMDATKEVRTNI
jgi:hypothetical protein